MDSPPPNSPHLDNSQTAAASVHTTPSTRVRKLAQGNLVVSSTSQSAVFNPATQSDSFPASHSQELCAIDSHPRVQQSVYGFELSVDNQPDITKKASTQQAARDHSTDVMVVDALSQRTSDGLCEVVSTEKMEPSPHKVIRHSPRAALFSLKNSGDTHSAANVDVDTVPSVIVRSSAFGERAETSSSSVEESQAMLGTSNSSPDQSADASTTQKSKPKKKTGRYVASRLMETTAAHRAKSSGQVKQDLPSRSMARQTTKSRTSTMRGGSFTPSTSKPRRQVSTPENTAPDESFNVSPLHCNKTVINRVFNDTESFFVPPPNATPANQKSSSSAVESKPPPRGKKMDSQEAVTQDRLDIAYSRYLQWLFLSSKASHAIKTEEAEVMVQLQTLSRENHKMRQKLSSLNQEYDRLQRITDLDEMLDLQKSHLGPIIDQFPELSASYNHMATALDATRHELLTEGIHVPDTRQAQQEYEECIMSALEESGQLLTEITRHTRRDVTTMSNYSQAIDSLSRSAVEQQAEISRCRGLVRRSEALANHDNSLKIQEIESKRL